ncbi:hypothetical protein COW36_16280 [bacterium (Candidatus Blackallbacteria) CG17_big_fil_post_rev_8_21_14_2_50_48_46]|uniref:Transglutaminase-like domain-containing protein n=1 Tax=bacterium (Candidatus Blackallbacteria) CG17_big_fil_post_rev_8_21_14_2_50_48_46 TaxID=2014261 RepID=A0A2M7G208_9BACT|nr:MAG: hypothetical protein COW64_16750 [bacterium (Candidatus Blackallbacteria) CG18_big_fil_WC_8_21_14_2_50_49_26]PIW15693.1 MAG: hypothetical protein COW36_16280 [bacterium (Candidatus Blackallbacteria) CG17_big_fil_post_rev_8_21_14_2_50_48_46]PIW48698.1 MAG: hypothetical protein COW20_08460 [bacterium (Candidatus Blackallbacteria) CG13_big_fil_rev_8_21_14_2_50_49_14]
MIETRPPWIYFFLLIPTLGVWALHDPQRLLGALGVLLIIGMGYFLPFVLKPKPLTLFLGTLFSFLFAYFVIYVNSAEIYVMIYSLRQFQALGLSLIAMIVLQWFSWRSQRFDWLLFSMGLLFLFSTVSPNISAMKPYYRWLVLVFVTLLIFSRLPWRSWRLNLWSPLSRNLYFKHIMFAFSAFLMLSLSVILLAEWVDDTLSENLSEYISNQHASWSGFSGNTHLTGNTEIRLSEQVALLIHSSRPMDYLRGTVLTSYNNGHWTPQEFFKAPREVTSPLLAKDLPADLDPYQLVYPGQIGSLEKQGFWARIRLMNHYQGITFLPPDAGLVGMPRSAPVYQNQYAQLRQERSQFESDYWVWVQTGIQPESEALPELLRDNLEISDQIRQLLKPLAEDITRSASSPLQKAHLLEDWFHQYFKYSLKVNSVTEHVDPTVDFILNRKPAYCSWFASGMVLMLRSLDIPAHVVSGWKGMEYHSMSQVWVVREKQAHDWVEVLERPSLRWRTFDPTPPGQLTELLDKRDLFSGLQKQLDALKIFLSTWQERLSESQSLQKRLEELRSLSLQLLGSPVFYLLVLVLGIFNYVLRRFLWRAKSELPGLAYLEKEPRLDRLYGRLFSALLARGYQDQPHLTLKEILAQAPDLLAPEAHDELSRILIDLDYLRFSRADDSEWAIRFKRLENRAEDWMAENPLPAVRPSWPAADRERLLKADPLEKE